VIEIPGVKLGIAVAGFAGGVASLSYLRPLSKLQAGVSVLTGALFATYVTPVVTAQFNLSQTTEHGAAFLLGLCAMNIIPGVLRASEYLRDHAGDITERLLPRRDGKGGDQEPRP